MKHKWTHERWFPLCSSVLVGIANLCAWNASTYAANWTELGPMPIATGPYTGRISAIAISATDPNRMFVAGASGGLWRSVDGGNTFLPLTDQLPTLAIGAVALDPTDHNVIYVGSGEANYANHSLYGLGLFKSTDGGDSWQTLAAETFAGRTFARLIVSPADGDLLYAAVGHAGGFPARVAAKGHPLRDGPVGVFRSSDGGSTWTQLQNGLPAVAATDLAMHPTDPDILYAAIGDIFGHPENGVYRSADGGDSWEPIGSFGNPSVGRISIAIAPTNSQRIYALVTLPCLSDGGNGFINDLYRSDDGGANWIGTNPGNSIQASYGWYLSSVVVDPSDEDVFLFGGVSLVRSLNGGGSYQFVTPPHVDIHALEYDSNGVLWCGNDGGLHRTVNNGTNWMARNNGLGLVQFYPGFSLHPTNPEFVIGGTQDNGTVRRTAAGTSWGQVLGGDGGVTALHPANPLTVFAEIQGTGNLYRSINGGANFNFAGSGIQGADRNCFLPPFDFSPTSSNTLLYATHRVYRSTNTGSTWAPISGDLTSGPPYAVRSLVIAPSADQTVYAATNDGRVLVSLNGGVDWTVKRTGVPGWRRVTRELAVDPTNDAMACLAVAQFGADKVLCTDDWGDEWTERGGDLPDVPANTIALHRAAGRLTMFVGTDAGVFMSCDAGAHWRRVGSGLPNSPVLDLRVDPTFHRLAASTLGRGVWSIPLPGTGDEDGNGRTDMRDVLAFQMCFSGPAGEDEWNAPDADCLDAFDFDFDGDVDVSDYICLGDRLGGP